MQTLQPSPTVRQSPSVPALNYAVAIIQKFWAAYSEYAWHYTGMLCEQHATPARNGMSAR